MKQDTNTSDLNDKDTGTIHIQPDIDRAWDIRFLDLAKYISTWSKDPSTQVGAVITDLHRRIVSVGYNRFARGVCDTQARLHKKDIKYKLTIHAERNAILFSGGDIFGCTLYTWPFMPCAPCASMIIQVGIQRVIAPRHTIYDKRWHEDFELSSIIFEEAGVQLDLYKF